MPFGTGRGNAAVSALLACAWSLAAAAADAPADLDRLMAELARNGAETVRFTEVRTSAALKQPIELRGTLSYVAPSHLEKHTVAPRDERLIVDRDTLVIERPATGERLTLRLTDYPAVRAFVESIRATLAGDLAALRRFYRVEIEGTAAQWRLYLLPREADMAEFVQQVEISGSGGRIARIEILEASGDRSVMTIAKGGA